MGDNIFLNGRTRSKSTLPETSVKFSRSPFKDARQKNRRTEAEGKGKAAEEENEDELNLSPKREFRLGDKRSPSPSPSGEWPRSKRLKPSHTGNDIENNTASSHSRHRSDSHIPPQSDRKRSATLSTPKSMSDSSTRLQSPAPEKKERARSVPLFPSFRDFPTIDIRDIPASPTRRFPPKLRIASFTSLQKLQSIPEPVQASVLTDVLPAEIATPIQDAFRVDYPMSPLTPLPEASPFKIPADATGSPEDRFISAGWGQDLLREDIPNPTNGPLSTESSATVNPSRLQSRLPRPTNAAASSSKAKTTLNGPPPRAAPGKSSTQQKPKRNAYDLMMPNRKSAKEKLSERTALTNIKGKDRTEKKDVKGKGKGSASVEIEPVKISTVKGKMKPRAKPPAKTVVPLIVPDEEDDESLVDPPKANDVIVYPLETLPSGASPLPPSSSSPIYSSEVNEGMSGIEVLRMDGEMKGEGAYSVKQGTANQLVAKGDNESSMPSLQGESVPRVPSPLFSEVPTLSPSPLSSEPEHMPQTPKGMTTESADSLTLGEPMDVVAEPTLMSNVKSSKPTSKRTRRQNQSGHAPVPRTTRSTTSKVPTSATESPKKGSRKAGKKASGKAVPPPEAEKDPDSTVASSSKLPVSLDEILPADSHIAPLDHSNPLTLPIYDIEGDSLSELSDLPDSYDFVDMEVPLKRDSSENVEMAEPSLVPDPEPDAIPTKSTKSSGKRKSIPQTSPREKSRRTRKSGDFVSDVPAASFTLAPTGKASKVATVTASTSAEKSSHAARPIHLGSTKSSAIPVSKTPARSHTMFFTSPGPKDTRPGSAPSSPTKLSHSFSYKPVSHLVKGETKALGELERALARLNKPKPEWPSRPNTSMGFNRDDPDSSIEYDATNTTEGKKLSSSIGLGRPSTTGKLQSSSSNAQASSSRSAAPIFPSKTSVQKPLSMFMPAGTGPGLQKNGAMVMRGGRSEQSGAAARFQTIGGVGPGSLGSRGKKASQKTTLDSIVASPVKGGGSRVAEDDDIQMVDGDGDITLLDIPMSGNDADMDISELSGGSAAVASSSRSLTLSQSMSALPTKLGLMGPPPLPTSPPRRAGLRSSSSSYPSSASGASGTSRPQAPAKFVPDSYTLEGCTVFVDVWMSDGQDTSSLYVEIAKNMGARIVKSIGPQCTHVVYTNGRPRTVEHYFALDVERRPKAVGASWLKDCQEAASRLDEEKYLVDLEEHRPSLLSNMITDKGEKPRHKRRQSYIPKFCAFDDDATENGGDVSMDGSNTSMVDDDLPPLERARMRQSMGSSTRK